MSYSCSDLADDLMEFCVARGIVSHKDANSSELDDNAQAQAALMKHGISELLREKQRLESRLKFATAFLTQAVKELTS